jgi:hypothetical protein
VDVILVSRKVSQAAFLALKGAVFVMILQFVIYALMVTLYKGPFANYVKLKLVMIIAFHAMALFVLAVC